MPIDVVMEEVFDEKEKQPVSNSDKKAVDIAKALGKNLGVASLVFAAYNSKRALETIKNGKDKISQNISDMAEAVVGKVNESSKEYQLIKEHQEKITAQYEKTMKAISSNYDKKVKALIAEKEQLQDDNVEMKTEQYMLKDSLKSSKRRSKSVAKDMKIDMKTAQAMRKDAMKAMARGDIETYEQTMQEAQEVESRLSERGQHTASKHSSRQARFQDNKDKIKANKDRIAEINEQIYELINERETKMQSAVQTQEKGLKKADKMSIREKVSMFLGRFAINKAKRLNERVFKPAEERISKIAETVGTGIVDFGKGAIDGAGELYKSAKTAMKEKSIKATDRLGKYITDKTQQLQDQTKTSEQEISLE